MGKLLFWFVVIVVLLLGARLLSHSAAKQTASSRKKKAPANPPDMSQAEPMVRCEHCGIHMPRSEAFLSNGHIWCGPEHARIGQSES